VSVGVDILVTQNGRPSPGEVLGSRLTYGPPMREVAAIDFIDCNEAQISPAMSGRRRHCHGLFRLYLIHRIKYFALQTNSKACG